MYFTNIVVKITLGLNRNEEAVNRKSLIVIFTLLMMFVPLVSTVFGQLKPGTKAPDFKLKDLDGNGHKKDIEGEDMSYPKLMGRGKKVSVDYKIRGIPWLYIFDSEGILRSSDQFLKFEEIKKVLDSIIVESEK